MENYVNIGCGQTPVQGWQNYDSSLSIRLAKLPAIVWIADKLGFLSTPQKKFIAFAKDAQIRWADAARHIPAADNSVDVLYSSHMLEHLGREEARSFLKEARRVLRHGGIIRLAVPDIRYHVENYLKNGDTDAFVEQIQLARNKPKTLKGKLISLIIGDRNHHWMYDGNSLCLLLSAEGFTDALKMEPGASMIPNPGDLNLKERIPESVFVEAIRP